MKNRTITLIILFGIISNFISSIVLADCRLTLRVTNLPPRYYLNENEEWAGTAVEIVEAVLAEANCTPIFKEIPWKRALVQMETGQLDMMMALSMTEDRKKYMYFVGPYQFEIIGLIVPKESNFKVSSFDDLAKLPKKIAIQRGSFYGKTFESKFKSNKQFADNFVLVTGSNQSISLLNKNRISGFFGDQSRVAYSIKHDEEYKDVKIHSFQVDQAPFYFGLSKKSVSIQIRDDLKKALSTANRKDISTTFLK